MASSAENARHKIPCPCEALVVRAATSADHGFLHAAYRAAFEPLTIRVFGMWNETSQRARLAEKITTVPFRVIELDGNSVGVIATAERDDHLYLHELFLLPAFQRRGIGSQVLTSEIERAAALDKPLRLHVARENRALRLYTRLGFVETKRDDTFVDLEHRKT